MSAVSQTTAQLPHLAVATQPAGSSQLDCRGQRRRVLVHPH